MISIVLGTYNRLKFLKLTIESIRKEPLTIPYEIIVVDGGSSDGTVEWLTQQKDIITIVQHNRGEWQGKKIVQRPWGYFMNLAFKCAQGKYVCMLSDDSILVPGAIVHGYEQCERLRAEGSNVGALAFYWRHWPEEASYHVGVPMGTAMYVNHGIYLKEALEAVGYIDETAYQFYFADIDLCFKLLQAGYICVDAENSYVEHYNHANVVVRKDNEQKAERDCKTFMQRWQPVFLALTGRNLGELKKKEFFDEHQTARQFDVVDGGLGVKIVKQERRKTMGLHLLSQVKRAVKKTLGLS